MRKDLKDRAVKAIPILIFLSALLSALLGTLPASAQDAPGRGRFSLYSTNTHSRPVDGDNWNSSEMRVSFSLQSPLTEEGNHWEYGIDVRAVTYPVSERVDRDTRFSIYDAYVGYRAMNGSLGIRGGQMWLNELGSLGSVGGIMAEWRQPRNDRSNRLRIGGFYGYEPKIRDFEYEPDVQKFGGYLAVDGNGSRRHVLGLVSIRNSGLTERNVLTTTNFIPVGSRFFLYQGAEIDLTGPAGNGSGELTYFYANARYRPVNLLEFQGSYHRGRSIDARTIAQDQLNNRPINPDALEGYLFESAGGKVWIRLPEKIRLFGGFSRSRNNRNDSNTDRIQAGLIITDLLNSGFDIHVSDTRIKREGLSSDSWYGSVGRNFGRRIYLSGEYASSLSILRILDTDNVSVESRPRNHRVMASGIIRLSRIISLNLTGEYFRDETIQEIRVLSGITYRFW